jgi:hypothetical protein
LHYIQENYNVPTRKPRWEVERLYSQRQKVQDGLEEELGAIKCESWNVENAVECSVLGTMSALVGKVERKARKPWISSEIISKMHKRKKWKNVNNNEGRKKYRRLGSELKRTTVQVKKENLASIYDELI